MSYRDQNGRFIPREMNAQEALDKNLGPNYMISDNYEGEPINGRGTLINDNPYWVGQFAPKNEPEFPKNPGHKPNFETVKEKFDH